MRARDMRPRYCIAFRLSLIFIRMAAPTDMLAGELEQALCSGAVPSLAQLARRFGVPRDRVRAAMGTLQDKGLISICQGRAGRLTPLFRAKHGLPAAPDGNAEDRLYSLMVSRIHEGVYRLGDFLPKMEYTARTERVSRSTFSGTIQRLARDGLVHRNGKRWQVGPAPACPGRRVAGVSRDTRSVIFLTPSEIDTHSFFTNLHLLPFQMVLRNELSRNNCRLEVGYQYKTGSEPVNTMAGIDEIEHRARTLGDRYAGTLVFSSFQDPDETRRLLLRLMHYRRAVVFLDAENQNPGFCRKALGAGRNYYRFFFDERAATTEAIRALALNGHRCVGYPRVNQQYYRGWVARRAALLREAAAAIAPDMRILETDLTEPFWHIGEPDAVEQSLFIERLSGAISESKIDRGHNPGSISGRAALKATPSLGSLLSQGMTACIACNDMAARDILFWFQAARIEVPGQVSLLSFDNYAFAEPYGISTIDFGFWQLGYKAAHLFIGDIPVAAGRDGECGGACSLVERGSLGSARDGVGPP